MDNQFLINFKEATTQPVSNFTPSFNNPIEIQDVRNKDSVIKAIKKLFSAMEMVNAEEIVNNVKKVSFNIIDSNKNMLWLGEGTINENQIDIIKIESSKFQR